MEERMAGNMTEDEDALWYALSKWERRYDSLRRYSIVVTVAFAALLATNIAGVIWRLW